jgi:3-isopropylmalate/(R)-2-methylmalate dehydratase large subunit
MQPKTLFEKVWSAHEVVAETAEAPAVLFIDLHLVHEVSSPQAFQTLRERALPVRSPSRTLATLDHATPTDKEELRQIPFKGDPAAAQILLLENNARAAGIELLGLQDPRRGIVHVVGPELGLTQPGMTLVCGDSHTSTHGAFGALAFGIGSTEVGHVLATQCILQRRPKTLAINVNGRLPTGVMAKDLILSIIQRIGTAGGTGHVIEYRGSTITSLSMEQRMTVCNMSIEAGARSAMIAPDATTIAYLDGRPRAPRGADWEKHVARWLSLCSDPGATFHASVDIDAATIEPMITYGTHPGMAAPLSGSIPERTGDPIFDQALQYMGFAAGESLLGKPIDVVFIGSCTNGRLEDLQAAAAILRGRHIAPNVRMLVVPGSGQVKREAEALGLADVFLQAGAQWREPGCSMCVAMNGDFVTAGHYAVSTSNRNFEGRQGPGARTLLASPGTAAASALAGKIADPRSFLS